MARRVHYSVTTLSDAAGGRKLPTLAATLAYVRACGGDLIEWEERWHDVAAELASISSGEETDAAWDRSGGRAPYAGLAAFGPDDADRFFGRERLIEDLLVRVRRQRFLAVFGASGSGKSSVLRAGLLPRAANGDLADGQPWPAILINPGPRPLEECAVRLARLLGVTAGPIEAELFEDPRALHRFVRQALVDHPAGVDLLLVIDQFEELFTLCQDPRERTLFIGALLAAVEASNSRIRVVLGVRADFYARCAEYADLVEALRDAQLLVGPMTTDELRRAITQPAAQSGCVVESALLARIIADATGQTGVLPLVSHALLETWRRRHGNTLTVVGYDAAGGIPHALARTAETIFTALNPEQQRLAKPLFIRLTALGDGTEDAKRRITLSTLEREDATMAAVLEALTRARLLTLDVDTVEMTHEALIRSWPRLNRWLAEDRDGIRIQRHLADSAAAWMDMDRDAGALYRGTRLAVATEWAHSADATLTPQERIFLDTSRRAARRGIRRRQLLTALGVILLVLSVVTSIIAVQQRQTALEQRRTALSRGMAAKATAMAGKPDAAMLLAVEAFRQAPVTEARSLLLSTQAQPFAARLTGHTGPVSSLAFSPDGQTLASAVHDTTKLWSVASRRETATFFNPTGSVADLAFSPDGHTLAIGSQGGGQGASAPTTTDGGVTLWDTASKQWNSTLIDHIGPVVAVEYSRDGRTLAVAAGKDVTLWNTATGEQTGVLTEPGGIMASLAFSPDGRMLATSSRGNPDTTSTPLRPVKLWDLASHHEITPLGGAALPGTIAFSPDSRTLAFVDESGDVRLWDAVSRSEIGIVNDPADVTGLAFSPDGQVLATSSTTSTSLWDVATRRRITALPGHVRSVLDVAFSPDGRMLATSSDDHTIALWDLTRLALTTHPATAFGPLAYSPDGRTVAGSSGSGGAVTLWDVGARRETATLTGHTSLIADLAFSPDGQMLATNSLDGTLKLWTMPFGRNTITIADGHDDSTFFTGMAFSPDERTIATAKLGTLKLWDTTTGKEVTVLTEEARASRGLAFAPDGRTMASGSMDGTVAWWDVVNRREIAARIPGHSDAVTDLAFSPDGRVLASTSTDGTLKFWDPASQRPVATVTAHTRPIRGVAFSPDGQTAATASEDQTVKLWHTATHHEIATLTGHTGSIQGLAFSPDGKTLATTSVDNTLRVWDIDEGRVVSQICDIIRNRITPEQWAQLIPDLPFQPSCH